MNLSEIEWGSDNAERDPNLLGYFITHPAMERLYKRKKTFIVGRKGTGKSAVRKKLISEFKKYEDNYLFEIIPTFSIIEAIDSDKDITKNYNSEVFFQYIWRNYLYKKALIGIGENPINCDHPSFKYAIQLARANEQKERTLLDSVKEVLCKIKIKAGKFGDLGIEIENTLRKNSEIDVYEYHLVKICESGYKISWIIDDIDIGWNNTDIINKLLLGLLTCSDYLKTLSQSLHIFICIREDLYRLLLTKTTHSDKYRDVEILNWTTDSLIDLLENRIKFNFKINNVNFSTEKPIFEQVFPKTVDDISTKDWLANRTLYRPRELLQFARLYTENNTRNLPDNLSLKKVELQYSKWKLDDLCSEFLYQYPGLIKFFDYWRDHFPTKYRFSKDEINLELAVLMFEFNTEVQWLQNCYRSNNFSELLKILYEIGFLGYCINSSKGNKVFYSYNDIYRPEFDEIVIHPCFRQALDISYN